MKSTHKEKVLVVEDNLGDYKLILEMAQDAANSRFDFINKKIIQNET